MTQSATSQKLDILVSNVMVHSMILALRRQKLKTHKFEDSTELISKALSQTTKKFCFLVHLAMNKPLHAPSAMESSFP